MEKAILLCKRNGSLGVSVFVLVDFSVIARFTHQNISRTLGACRKIPRKVPKLIRIPSISTTRSRIFAAICQSMWFLILIISSWSRNSSKGSNTYFPCCLSSTWSSKIGVSRILLCVLVRVRCMSDGWRWTVSLQHPFPSQFDSFMMLMRLISQGAEYEFSEFCVKSQFSSTINCWFRLFLFVLFFTQAGSYFILTRGPRILNMNFLSHLGIVHRW